MNSEEIIKDQAEKFSRQFGVYVRKNDGESEFKSDLELKLYDFDESIDKLIFLYQIKKNIVTKIEKHKERCNYSGKGTCPTELTWHTMMFYVEQEIKSLNPKFEYSILRPHVNSSIINENLKRLEDYPDASKAYFNAIDKLNQGNLERNLMDDLRLSLELLLKSVLNNNKSLENQEKKLGAYLKAQNVSGEIRNMFIKLLDYYSKYQNNYIKHNDNIQREEVDLMINLTSSFVNFLINK